MKEIILKVSNVECEGCENRIKNAISKIKGVKEINVSHETKILKVIAKDDIEKEIREKLDMMDFKVEE